MKAKTSEPTIALDKQLNRLVKKSVEGCSASSGAWSNIIKAIQMDQPAALTPKEAKPALSLSD
jgi:hypothetical protein